MMVRCMSHGCMSHVDVARVIGHPGVRLLICKFIFLVYS
jgi:hypothetical protein